MSSQHKDPLLRDLESFNSSLDGLSRRFQAGMTAFLEALLVWLEAVGRRLSELGDRIADYLEKLLPLVGSICLKLLRIGVFYIPAVAFLLMTLASSGALEWLFLFCATGWTVLVTVAGLSHRVAPEAAARTSSERTTARGSVRS